MCNWSLFLAHPTYWHKRVTSENAQDPSWCWCRVFKVSCKNQSLETIQVCFLVLCFPHNNVASVHLYDECKRSNEIIVCDKLWSILWSIVQVCSQTTKYQVSQYEPNTDISEHFVSKLWTILQVTHFLLLNIESHLCMALRLCVIVESFYSQVRNIFPHISLRNVPCHETKILCVHQVLLKLSSVIFLWLQQKFWIRTWLCSLPLFHYWSYTLSECIPNTRGQEMMLVLPDQRLPWELSKSVLCFLLCLPLWYRPHTLIGIVLLLGWQIDIFKQFSQPCSNRTFSNCLSHNSPAKGWPYRIRSRGTTGSSILDHDFDHLCFGRRIQISGQCDFGIFKKRWCIFHFDLGVSRYCVCCLSCASWYNIHDFCGCHLRCWMSLFSEHRIRNRIIFHNVASEYNSTLKFVWCFVSNSAFFKWQMSISETKWTFAPFVLASSITSFLLLTFVRFHAEFSPIFLIPWTRCFCCRNYHGLRHMNKFVYQIIML